MLAEGPVGGSVFADHRPQVRVRDRVVTFSLTPWSASQVME